MQTEIDFHIDALDAMKKYPKELHFRGNLALLKRQKMAIVGSRKPNQYAREMTHILASKLAKAGVCIVSGGAIGVDAIAHKAVGSENTIMVAATGLDKRYPAINKKLIESIEEEGLVLSQFAEGTPSTKYNFVLRNELVVALGDVLIVTYADVNSGTMRSVEYALKMGKKIFVLAHRIGESEATNRLLSETKAEAIYDIDSFVKKFTAFDVTTSTQEDTFLDYCKATPTYEEALKRFPTRLFEAELGGEIFVKNAKVYIA
ncbi:Rossmann fold nucleotide-binding protein Smf possibly involved in DNA uptake [hydrothermal vent metagenome]|uniref:Rossmann fold nucleotide-binding protein Smf possibly involved in DNA uptake n=1 Tax=hydrothermal vent metagenome TaxID=652676 RepID=A0A1W1C271_9ZZZZ